MPAGVRGPRRAKRAGRRLHTAVRLLDEQQAAYVDAQALMAQGELEQARQAFLALEEYQDSAQLAKNSGLSDCGRAFQRYGGSLIQYKYFIELGDFLDSRSRALECLPEIAEEGIWLV